MFLATRLRKSLIGFDKYKLPTLIGYTNYKMLNLYTKLRNYKIFRKLQSIVTNQ